jgi:hypothetical protein
MIEARNIKLTIALKTAPTTATTLESVGDTSMADIDLQVVIIG